jgi:toxin-antitoxin system PIN domain toxin
VGIPWLVILGFIRIMTSRRVLVAPLPLATAVDHARSWLAQPVAEILQPEPRHLELIESLAAASGATGDLATDLHLAALAIEYQAELHSNDVDFRCFPGLRRVNTLR